MNNLCPSKLCKRDNYLTVEKSLADKDCLKLLATYNERLSIRPWLTSARFHPISFWFMKISIKALFACAVNSLYSLWIKYGFVFQRWSIALSIYNRNSRYVDSKVLILLEFRHAHVIVVLATNYRRLWIHFQKHLDNDVRQKWDNNISRSNAITEIKRVIKEQE